VREISGDQRRVAVGDPSIVLKRMPIATDLRGFPKIDDQTNIRGTYLSPSAVSETRKHVGAKDLIATSLPPIDRRDPA
jgi:hypothetical protein